MNVLKFRLIWLSQLVKWFYPLINAVEIYEKNSSSQYHYQYGAGQQLIISYRDGQIQTNPSLRLFVNFSLILHNLTNIIILFKK